MAGLSDATRSMLNKGQSLYKAGLGDLLHDALVEASANTAADQEDQRDDYQVVEKLGEIPQAGVLASLVEKVQSLESAQSILQAALAQNSAISPETIQGLVACLQEVSSLADQLKTSVLSLAEASGKQTAAINLIATRVQAATPAGLVADVAAVLA